MSLCQQRSIIVTAMVFVVVMYECDSWTIKKAERQRIEAFKLVLEKTPECPLDCKESKAVYPKGNHPWIFTGKTEAEAEAPILWPLDSKSWLIRKDPDAGKDWRQEEKGTTEYKMMFGLLTDSMDMSLSKLRELWCTGKPGMGQYMGSQGWTWLGNWTIERQNKKTPSQRGCINSALGTS